MRQDGGGRPTARPVRRVATTLTDYLTLQAALADLRRLLQGMAMEAQVSGPGPVGTPQTQS